MRPDDPKSQPEHRDFFISYTSSDQQWAEWIAIQLEQAGYTLFIQAWDFRPGSNFVAEMDKATKCAAHTLLVLSPAYLVSEYAFPEWAAAFHHDPKGTYRHLLPVRIQPCAVEGLLGPLVYIDLVQLSEEQASERLLSGIQQRRVRPATVAFPGQNIPHAHAPFPGSLPALWNIPYLRNPVFTGREQLLTHLAEKLHPGEAVALTQPQVQAISGLGGIGKTQLAVEYAYRHRQDYQAVFWTRADTADALIKGYGEIACLLQLPEKEEQDQSRMVKAVQEWLRTQSGWLLILDNADDLMLARTYLPSNFGGHILLTTRAQSMGKLAARIEVQTLDQDMGALLLLRRAGLVAMDTLLDVASLSDLALARALAEELGGLPLALDQAGAYIEETACDLSEYQRLYQTRAALLRNRRGMAEDHPEPVATTWSLSFAQVEQHHPAAADLLRLCAFLASDAIPEELLTEGAKALGTILAPVAADSYLLNQAITALRAYSLLARDPQAHTLTIHRLVQAVLRESMPVEIQQHWMQRAVLAVYAAFPSVTFENWSACEWLLPHALVCATWVKQAQIMAGEAAQLLNLTGGYLQERGRYADVETLQKLALAINEQQFGSEHTATAVSLVHLGFFYEDQGKYMQAEPLLERALAIFEQQLGGEHLNTASCLNHLAMVYRDQGKYMQAEPLLERALAICEQQLGADHPDTAGKLNNLAALYQSQGKYMQAEPLLERALAIYKQQLGTEHPTTAVCLNNLADVYERQGKYAQAEPLLERALAICEQQLGADHPTNAVCLNNLANVYRGQGKHAQAEPLLERALAICEQQLGADHPNTATTLYNLARLYERQKKYTQAEPLLERTLAIYEQQLGAEHPNTVGCLNYLAMLYRGQEKYEQAEPLLERVLAICEQQLGANHPDTADKLNNLACVYESQEKYAEAEPLFERALAIREQQLGSEHLDTATSLNNLALLYKDQGKYTEAESLYQCALTIYEQQLGIDHPDTAVILYGLARLYESQGKYTEAEPLLERALATCEQQLGADHLDTAIRLYSLAKLYYFQRKYEQAEPLLQRVLTIDTQVYGTEHTKIATDLDALAHIYNGWGKYAEAKSLYQRTLAIYEQQLGAEHPDTASSLNNLAALYQNQGKYMEAEPLYVRALAIYEQQLGVDHPTTQTIKENYTSLLAAMKRDW